MSLVLNDTERRWEARIERARALQSMQPAFAEALRLYELTLKFQRDLALRATAGLNPELPLRLQIDISLACSHVPAILSVALKHGPDALRARAELLQKWDEPAWRRLFKAAALDAKETARRDIDDFFLRACLQSIAENLQSQLPSDRNYTKSICPACEGLPQLAVLRPEGEGASRSLLCSFCLREWLFRRIICPFCGEKDKEKLPRYRAEESDCVIVEGCDTCKHYLKAVDMSIDGCAVPLVDEAAWAVLDLWAVDHGYTKIIPNLIGF